MDTTRYDLADCFAPDPASPSRRFLVKEPGLTMLYLTLMPGQAMPVHNHPGCNVTIHGMVGEATVWLDGEEHPLGAQQLICFSGERMVSPRNKGDAPAAVLITLGEVAVPGAQAEKAAVGPTA